jgi:hypothetical protein
MERNTHTPTTLVIRDPDWETEVQSENLPEHDEIVVDLGASFNGPKYFWVDQTVEEALQWLDDLRLSVAHLAADGPIRRRVEELIVALEERR